MPDFGAHALDVPFPGAVKGQDTLVLGEFLRDVVRANQDHRHFRIFGPDETLSNLLGAVFEATNRQWDARAVANDEFLASEGRVLDSTLSEHQCEGWLEGYLLTSHVWQQDHNGFTYQDPGFLDHVVNKKADIVRLVSVPGARSLAGQLPHVPGSSIAAALVAAPRRPRSRPSSAAWCAIRP
jgi:xylulose-5-phosphate/fructose-6-phosphate phosphoketolase